ncbi:tRNA (cytidine(34)-2'-O)-methyltransferase [Thalassoglobus sp. JC818]|uniref:tRNA (cytidine(34)-2'-O)-methyltransferase n=1 Tax=Thalassoglobus sp. JC818 TaxID=3232136 RepID=UPI00345A7304
MPKLDEPSLHVVLHSPEIPPNTGNIGRTCVAVGAKLWLVKPIGYSLEDKYLRRAGLDYWQYLDFEIVEDWDHLLEKLGPDRNYWYLTKFGEKVFWDAEFNSQDVLVFGSESKGLPEEIRTANSDHCLRLPMRSEVRSLNLASAATAVIYEAMRQLGGVE